MDATGVEDGGATVGWLLLLLVSFAAGILWADANGPALPFAAVIRLALVVAGGVVVGIFVCARHRCRLRRIGIAALVGLCFAAGHQALDRELVRARDGALLAAEAARRARGERAPPRLVDATVVERRATGFGEEVELRDLRGRAGEGALPERVILAWGRGASAAGASAGAWTAPSRAEALLWPGTRVRLAIRLEPLRAARNPGSPDRERALARRGIGARARLFKPDWVVETIDDGRPDARAVAALVALRRSAVERVRLRLPGVEPGAGLARALALGDRRELSETTRRAFRALGLAHLLSVSGLHIGFVALPAAAAVARLRVLARPRARPVRGFATPIMAGILVALGYAWLTGGSVPALRSGLLFAVFGLARGTGSTLTPGTALAAVALALLVADPAALFDPGARFSFTACAALIAAGAWGASPERAPDSAVGPEPGKGIAVGSWAGDEGLRRGVAGLVDPMRASLAVSLGLLPWVELEGLPRSLPSPLVNAVAIPWTGFVVLPGALAACLLAWLLPEAEAGGATQTVEARVLRGLLWPGAALESAAARLAVEIPASLTGEDRAGALPWAIGGVLILVGFQALRRGRVVAAGIVWVALGGLGLAPIREEAFARERPRVVFFDVGQADAALVETADAAWLIDSGSGPEDGSGGGALLRGLRALGVERLDGLVITHGDLDHRGGARRVLSALPVGEIWLPALARPDPALIRLAADARERAVRVAWVGAGDRHRSGGDLALEVLWPPASSAPKRTEERRGGGLGDDGPATGRARNEQSIVLRATLGGRAVLFMADVGTGVERALGLQGRLGPVEILKLGHHGSRASSDPAFLAQVEPDLAIVSAPCEAARGLPSPVALARVRAAGIGVAWTGRDGAVAVGWTTDGDRRTSSWGAARDCEGDGSRRRGSGRRAGVGLGR